MDFWRRGFGGQLRYARPRVALPVDGSIFCEPRLRHRLRSAARRRRRAFQTAHRSRANLSPRHRRRAGGADHFPDLGAQSMNHWLTILTLVPFLGGIVIAGLGAERKNLVRGLALAISLVGLGDALCMWLHFDPKSGDLQ